MYSGYWTIEFANERVRERLQAAETYRLVKQARQARAAQSANRGPSRMGSLLKLLGRAPKHSPEVAAGAQDQRSSLPQVSAS